MILPSNIRKYFWDIDTKRAKPKSFPKFYIDRLLELGNENSINWLKKMFGPKRIKSSLNSSKISKKSRNFWKLVFS